MHSLGLAAVKNTYGTAGGVLSLVPLPCTSAISSATVMLASSMLTRVATDRLGLSQGQSAGLPTGPATAAWSGRNPASSTGRAAPARRNRRLLVDA